MDVDEKGSYWNKQLASNVFLSNIYATFFKEKKKCSESAIKADGMAVEVRSRRGMVITHRVGCEIPETTDTRQGNLPVWTVLEVVARYGGALLDDYIIF